MQLQKPFTGYMYTAETQPHTSYTEIYMTGTLFFWNFFLVWFMWFKSANRPGKPQELQRED